jgi:hypothetical protein
VKPIETSIRINGRPPAAVAEALLAPDKAVKWQSNLEKCEVISGSPGEVGATTHLHFTPPGKRHVLTEVLEYAEPGRRYVSRMTGDGMVVKVETLLQAEPHGTKLTMHWSASSPSLWTRLLLRIARSAIAQRAEIDLQAFKCLIENHG